MTGAVPSFAALAPALHPNEVVHLEALARAIGFRPEDLAAHRCGRFSTEDRLKSVGIACVPLGIAVPIVVAIALTTSSVERFAPAAAVVMGVAVLLSGLILFHVESHAAQTMRVEGLSDATLHINKAPCTVGPGCANNLVRMLPEGARLRVIGPDGYDHTFVGTPDAEGYP